MTHPRFSVFRDGIFESLLILTSQNILYTKTSKIFRYRRSSVSENIICGVP
jgi:hypothetical protein